MPLTLGQVFFLLDSGAIVFSCQEMYWFLVFPVRSGVQT